MQVSCCLSIRTLFRALLHTCWCTWAFAMSGTEHSLPSVYTTVSRWFHTFKPKQSLVLLLLHFSCCIRSVIYAANKARLTAERSIKTAGRCNSRQTWFIHPLTGNYFQLNTHLVLRWIFTVEEHCMWDQLKINCRLCVHACEVCFFQRTSWIRPRLHRLNVSGVTSVLAGTFHSICCQ